MAFQETMIIIHHQGCTLQKPYKERRKLILPLKSCASSAGKIRIFSNNLKKIHWAQHDPKTVWVVATFSKPYQFKITAYPDKYVICLPFCNQQAFQAELQKLKESKRMMFTLQGTLFQIPLPNMLIDEFLAQSIGFIPKDIIRDGLPHFGAKRDDWKRQPRKHQGYDIYVDNAPVIAAAYGTVIKVKKSYRAGLYVKLRHSAQLDTVYVHLKTVTVKKGQRVNRGDVIGQINGPTGNAISPQLHFEIKVKNKSIDPLPLIENFYKEEDSILEKINHYKQSLLKSIYYREKRVQELLSR